MVVVNVVVVETVVVAAWNKQQVERSQETFQHNPVEAIEDEEEEAKLQLGLWADRLLLGEAEKGAVEDVASLEPQLVAEAGKGLQVVVEAVAAQLQVVEAVGAQLQVVEAVEAAVGPQLGVEDGPLQLVGVAVAILEANPTQTLQ